MTSICGEDGKENGINCSYLLVDNFFTRQFMTYCSWAGGSRNTAGGKIPFKIYINTMSLFHTLVQRADKDFSMIHCQQFFKKVMKNSTRRNSCGPITRTSRAKSRPSRMIYKKCQQLISNDANHKGLLVINEVDKDKESVDAELSDEHSIEQHVDNDYYADDADIFVKTETNLSPSN